MERYDYQTSFRVFEWETDKNGIMTTGSLLRRVQQLGTDHCESIGLNDDVYERCGAVFLMVKSVAEWNSRGHCTARGISACGRAD